jgi:hypothetical protein
LWARLGPRRRPLPASQPCAPSEPPPAAILSLCCAQAGASAVLLLCTSCWAG